MIEYEPGTCDVSGLFSNQCFLTQWLACKLLDVTGLDEGEETRRDYWYRGKIKFRYEYEGMQKIEVVLSKSTLTETYQKKKQKEINSPSRKSSWGVVLSLGAIVFGPWISYSLFNQGDSGGGYAFIVFTLFVVAAGIWSSRENRLVRDKLHAAMLEPDPAEFKELSNQLAHDTALKKAQQLNCDRVWKIENENSPKKESNNV
jgi:hypothetical protein